MFSKSSLIIWRRFNIQEPAWTEYIEVGFAEAVYALGIELGSPRGAGAVTGIKVRKGKGKGGGGAEAAASAWTSIFSEYAQTGDSARLKLQGQYHRWSPQVRRAVRT